MPLLNRCGGGAGKQVIKSIQFKKVIPTTTTTDTVIDAVDVDKTVVLATIIRGTHYDCEYLFCEAYLNSPTVLRLSKTNSYGTTHLFTYLITIIEFDNVRSVQHGRVTMPGTAPPPITLTTPIVDINKAQAFVSFSDNSTSELRGHDLGADPVVTGPTTLTTTNWLNGNMSYYVVEFY